MFYPDHEKQRLNEELADLRRRATLLESELDVLAIEVKALRKVCSAPYGLKADGTPRAKPGRPRKAA